MAVKTGVPLTGLPEFSADTLEALADYWITTVQEFQSAAQQSGGVASLADVLGMNVEQVAQLLTAANAIVPPQPSLADERTTLALGAILVDTPPRGMEALALADLPTEVDLRNQMAPVRNQLGRPTCVAYAVAALRENRTIVTGNSEDLSEQYLYWKCKENDGHPSTRGTWISVAMKMLHQAGICLETTWPYVADDLHPNEGQGPPPENAHDEALSFCMDHQALVATSVQTLKQVLADGNPVAFSVPVYESWGCRPSYAYDVGDIRMPLPGEQTLGGHAMCLVGFVDDSEVPGGGYFLVRNSWGKSFGYYGEYARGHCRLPYQYLKEFGNEAFAIV